MKIYNEQTSYHRLAYIYAQQEQLSVPSHAKSCSLITDPASLISLLAIICGGSLFHTHHSQQMAGTQRGLLLAVLLAVVAPATAKDYAVGDASGWKPGVDYTAWAKGKTFSVGDSLSFQYSAGHSVEEVTAAGYSACSASNALGSHKDESTSIPLTKPGTRYFICGASGHCAAGMKLAVTVSDPSAPATTTASPTADSTSRRPAAGSDTDSDSDSDESGAAGRAVRLVTGLLFGVLGLAALMG